VPGTFRVNCQSTPKLPTRSEPYSLFTHTLLATLQPDSQSNSDLVGRLRVDSECRGEAADHPEGGTRSLPLHVLRTLKRHSQLPRKVLTTLVRSGYVGNGLSRDLGNSLSEQSSHF
jgi:hypothetical protein